MHWSVLLIIPGKHSHSCETSNKRRVQRSVFRVCHQRLQSWAVRVDRCSATCVRPYTEISGLLTPSSGLSTNLRVRRRLILSSKNGGVAGVAGIVLGPESHSHIGMILDPIYECDVRVTPNKLPVRSTFAQPTFHGDQMRTTHPCCFSAIVQSSLPQALGVRFICTRRPTQDERFPLRIPFIAESAAG